MIKLRKKNNGSSLIDQQDNVKFHFGFYPEGKMMISLDSGDYDLDHGRDWKVYNLYVRREENPELCNIFDDEYKKLFGILENSYDNPEVNVNCDYIDYNGYYQIVLKGHNGIEIGITRYNDSGYSLDFIRNNLEYSNTIFDKNNDIMSKEFCKMFLFIDIYALATDQDRVDFKNLQR